LATRERDPRPYELMTVFIPELSEEDTQAQVDKVATYIANAGGSLTETLTSSPWGRRRLAYTIRFNGVDYRDGFYTVYHFDSAPSNLTELERELKLDTNIMRYLLVHDDPKAGEQFTEEEGEGEEITGEDTADEGTTPVAEAPSEPTEEEAGEPAEEPVPVAAATDADASGAEGESTDSDDTPEKE